MIKLIKGLVWYEQDGKTIKRKVETDSELVWGRLMEYFNGNWYKATKEYRSYLGMTNRNIHKIDNE